MTDDEKPLYDTGSAKFAWAVVARPATRIPLPGEVWQHFKGGLYNIVMLVTLEANGDTLVIYEGKDGKRWARPIANFIQVGPFDAGTVDANHQTHHDFVHRFEYRRQGPL